MDRLIYYKSQSPAWPQVQDEDVPPDMLDEDDEGPLSPGGVVVFCFVRRNCLLLSTRLSVGIGFCYKRSENEF